MRRTVLILLGLVLAGVMIAGVVFVTGWTGSGPAREDKTFTLPHGATLKDAGAELEKAGLISSADRFYLRARLLGASSAIKAGEYLVSAGASEKEILAILTGGVGVNRFITIPEGMPSILVYERLMAADQLTGSIEAPAEGSILPDTYAYDRGESRVEVLARMQGAMAQVLDAAWANRAPHAMVNSKAEALTLASIVEKETSLPAERRMVAGVYSNRLRVGMRLQADPTIIYPITRGKPLGRRIKRSEIMAVNRYNTYSMAGLPKGPIANPGKASIEAVLNPEKTQALYFVADGSGGHVFADTLEEHNANVRKWFALRKERGI
ncbi:MAG: endolytic transglycosylase MltG [Sphingobium sp.]|nr:endolytic transglycosylase MltG [Sphingobium sp.]MBP6112908.1 endolytic transglycosylase MltG [Sphingobium sp.]MBP8672412.1 endolytic transglycosylase MltG [Sphingobium sp.]MBP9156290.1 endolytic transglycosylase MltG [Sphingobium sp.]MCC6482580.1 endolytic transglycosylase MltG [Sphingomonadaceae bacterium]